MNGTGRRIKRLERRTGVPEKGLKTREKSRDGRGGGVMPNEPTQRGRP